MRLAELRPWQPVGNIVSMACPSVRYWGFNGSYAHLLPVVQTLVVVLEHGTALLLAGVVFSGGVDNVAGEDVLPEGEAS